MPAIPALITAGGMLGGSYLGGRAANSVAKSAAARSPEELALMKQQTASGNQFAQQGRELFATAMPGIQNTLNYYQTLLNGNRGARLNAVAPEAEDIGSAYAGADKAVSRRLVGGERDQALAENSRARAGQISRLITGTRPEAAAGMAGLAPGILGAGAGMQEGGANIFAGLLNNSTNNRQQANQMGQQAGANTAANIGAIIARLLGTYQQGRGTGNTNPAGIPTGGAMTGYNPTGSVAR